MENTEPMKSVQLERLRNWRRSKKGVITRMYLNQKVHSKQRGHSLPNYTRAELEEWIHKQGNFDDLYNAWVASGYDRMSAVSIDRDDDYKPYTLDNLRRLCSFRENNSRSHKDFKNGINNKISKAIKQYTKDGKFIKEYYSVSQASREIGCSISGISAALSGNLSGKDRNCYGYKWEYVKK